MKFNSTRNKISKIYKSNSDNNTEIGKLVKLNIKFNQTDFSKKITKIPIFSGLATSDIIPINYNILLENCPDWAIPMIRPIAVFSTESGYSLEDGTFQSLCTYLWEKIDDINFKCNIYLNVSFYKLIGVEYVDLPLYVDLNLYFINLRDNYEIYKFEKQI